MYTTYCNSTSFSLLQQLRNPHDVVAWDRFVDLYLPLLFFWARRLRIRGTEPEEFVHEVFAKLKEQLPNFKYDPANGSFRFWLRTVCQNHWRDHLRKRATHDVQVEDGQLEELAQTDDGLEEFWNRDYHALLLRRAFHVLDTEFEETTRRAFIEVVMNGRPVKEVAAELGLSANAVSTRKFRVLTKLREELAALLE
jgi:RNA polymerase sigma-70 factor, ECF subfamily